MEERIQTDTLLIPNPGEDRSKEAERRFRTGLGWLAMRFQNGAPFYRILQGLV